MAVTVSFSAPGVPVLTPTLTDAVQAAWSYRSAAAASAASAATDAAAVASLHAQFEVEYSAFSVIRQNFSIYLENVYSDFNAARDATIAAVEGALNIPPPVLFLSITTTSSLVSGKQYSLDATTGTITLTLPAAPADGDSIRIIDGQTIGTGPTYIVARNGNTIGNIAEDITLDTVGLDVMFRFKSGNWRLF